MKRTTSSTELLLRIDRTTGVPLRVQLQRELRGAIQTGRLKAGALLPSTRVLAADFEVSRGVVVEAYEQLLAEGYLRAHHGSATIVAGRRTIDRDALRKETARVPPRYDFRPGVPDLSLFPRRAWVGALRRAFASMPDAALDYPDPRGAARARRVLATYLNRARATAAREDRVVFCNGSAQAIDLLSRMLRNRGVRRIAVEDPGYADQCTSIEANGLETPRVPVDDRGMCVDRLRRLDVGAVLVTPAHQYPTGSVLSPERRAALLEWAAAHRALIIEDDYDAEYRYDREPIGALQGLAPEHVVYVGSASKVLSPALRLGWLLVPPDFVADITRTKRQADNGSATPEQLTLAEFIETGAFDTHLRRTRQIYRRRRDALVTSLHAHFPHLRLRGVAAGLHVLIELDPGVDERAVVEAAARRSIRVFGGARYRAKPLAGPAAILVGYGGLPESTIPEAVQELARVLAECGQPKRPTQPSDGDPAKRTRVSRRLRHKE